MAFIAMEATEMMRADAFANVLRAAAMTISAPKRHALEYGAALVLDAARSYPGTYQRGAAPFPGWAALAPSTLADKARQGYDVPSPLRRTGALAASYGSTIGTDRAYVGSNYDIAVYQELGTSRIPARSVVGLAAARNGRKIADAVGRAVHAHLLGGVAPLALAGARSHPAARARATRGSPRPILRPADEAS